MDILAEEKWTQLRELMSKPTTFNLVAISSTEFTCLDIYGTGFVVIIFLVLKK